MLFPPLQKTTARVTKPRVSRTKGHLSKRTAFVRDLVKEVAGYVFHSSQPLRGDLNWGF